MKWQVFHWAPDFPVEKLRAAQPPLPDVQAVFEAVAREGDGALYRLTEEWDGVRLSHLRLPPEAIEAATVPSPLAEAIQKAYEHLLRFHRRQVPEEVVIETAPGILCGLRHVPIERVGLYVPGGTAPLFSTVLMLGVAAQVAGVPSVALATPPNQEGKVSAAILYAARLCGISEIYTVGGAQAIAAFALGTETILPVAKIAGPGNRFVQAAKLEAARRGVAIDMPAGPSEVVVVADAEASPEWVAADLLAQAEHGPDSLIGLITPSSRLLSAVEAALTHQLKAHPRFQYIAETLQRSWALLTPSLEIAVEIADKIAPEHLILACEEAGRFLPTLRRCGSVFLGYWSPESAGDYASGTNHVLPTGGTARSYGSLTVQTFLRSFTYQKLSPEGVKYLSPTVITMAEAEGLPSHAEAMRLRYEKVQTPP